MTTIATLPHAVEAANRLAAEGHLTDATTAALAARAKSNPNASADELCAFGITAIDPERGVRLKANLPLPAKAEATAIRAFGYLLGGDLNAKAGDYRTAARATLADNPHADPWTVHLKATAFADARFKAAAFERAAARLERKQATRAEPPRTAAALTADQFHAELAAAIPALIAGLRAEPNAPLSVDDRIGRATLLRLANLPGGSVPQGFTTAARILAVNDPALSPEALVGRAIAFEGWNDRDVREALAAVDDLGVETVAGGG